MLVFELAFKMQFFEKTAYEKSSEMIAQVIDRALCKLRNMRFSMKSRNLSSMCSIDRISRNRIKVICRESFTRYGSGR